MELSFGKFSGLPYNMCNPFYPSGVDGVSESYCIQLSQYYWIA